jgi:hypothetical protein
MSSGPSLQLDVNVGAVIPSGRLSDLLRDQGVRLEDLGGGGGAGGRNRRALDQVDQYIRGVKVGQEGAGV